MAGLIHVYCGDGKGKTTASVGLSVRAAGFGLKVIFSQFYKDGTSSEIGVLKSIPGITVHVVEKRYGFFKFMSDEEKECARKDYTALLEKVIKEAENADVLVLDEIISAVNNGSAPEDMLVDFLENKPEKLEVIITGRNPSERLTELADYVTEMKKHKHPFDRGISAREGIEY